MLKNILIINIEILKLCLTMLCKKIKLYNTNRALQKAVLKKIWLAFFESMKNKRKKEILLQVIERIYSKSLGMQTLDR